MEVLHRRFSNNFQGKNPLRTVANIRSQILKEMSAGETNTLDEYVKVFQDTRTQDFFGLQLPTVSDPKIVDLSEYLNLERGRVLGLDLTALSEYDSFKYPMVCGLYTIAEMAGSIDEDKTIITDCGIYNSQRAARNLAERLGLSGEYVSPESIEHLNQLSRSGNFQVVNEDKSLQGEGVEVKNACYRTLVKRLLGIREEDKSFAEKAIYLGHGELGWAAMIPVARAYKQALKENGITPDAFVSCVGAGTTSVPFTLEEIARKNYLVEYQETPIMTNLHNLKSCQISGEASGEIEGYDFERHLESRKRISRKFEENPFIPSEFWDMIDGSCLVEGTADYSMLCKLIQRGVRVGLTTAGNLCVAKEVAEQEGKVVVTPVFEKSLIKYAPRER